MNRYVIKLLDGEPICIVTQPNKQTYFMEGKELIKFLCRIDEGLFGRKFRHNPIYDEKMLGDTLIYVHKFKKKNIRIRDYPITIGPLLDLYREYEKEIDQEFKRNKKVVKGKVTAVTTIMVGGLALAAMAKSCGTNVDLENTARYEQETVREYNNNRLHLIISDEVVEEEPIVEEQKAVEENVNTTDSNSIAIEEITENEIESIVNAPVVNLDVEAVYDQGIENNVSQYLPDIQERGARRGVGDRLLHDIISQESSGKLDNLVQFEFNIWKDRPITSHNFESNKDETIVFSNDPSKWYGKADQIITEEEMLNPKTNISTAAILLQYYAKLYNYNIPLAIQAYNRGENNVNELLRKTAEGEGCTVEDLINDKTGTRWIDYSWKDENGLTYFEEVAKHIDENQLVDGMNDEYTISHIVDGEVVTESIQAQLQTNSYTK